MKTTNCPRCNSELHISKEVKLYNKIRCPKCKKEFNNPFTKKQPTSISLGGLLYKGFYPLLAIIIIYLGVLFYKSEVKPSCSIDDIAYYELYEYDIIPYEKYSARIRTKRILSKEELRNLANCIYDNYNLSNYKRVFLTYHLPNMKFGEGAWATTHFDPDLEILIGEE